ncbi:MAG: LacI family DNA-binding transcriptional regulator [Rubrivivax sp.]|nr:MAG: LacI family DNA-binding transcriptional regulator [Rubrivivax sp.]
MADQINAVAPLLHAPLAESRARMHDVAREAGVSLATVDRALNQRPGVSARTLLRVREAVQRLAERPGAQLTSHNDGRLLCFLLPSGENSFVAELREELHALAPWLSEQGARAEIRTTDAFAPAAAAAAVRRLRGQYDAVVLMVSDDPLVREAVERLDADGTCVLTLVSDIKARNRSHFVGIDHLAAGRTAASLMGRFVGPREGRIGIVIGAPGLHDHAEQLAGFRQLMATEHPQLEVLAPLESRDGDERSGALVRQLLARHADLVGLYTIGAGNAGVHAELRAAGGAGLVAWVCHELTSHTRAALLDGCASAVIGQNARLQARAACRVALARLARQRGKAEDERIRIEIFLKDNLP